MAVHVEHGSHNLEIAKKPDSYSPPKFTQVDSYHRHIKDLRRPVIDRIWEVKKARRGDWSDVVAKIPSAYRKMLLDPDLPQVRDFMQRAVGLIVKNRPEVQVMPPTAKQSDVTKAGREEVQLTALHQQIEDQQDRDTYAMSIDAQAVWGESWIGVWPDPSRVRVDEIERGKKESATDYIERQDRRMSEGGVPVIFDDYDPQSVYPFFLDKQRLGIVIVETEHLALDIELQYGYTPIRNPDGNTSNWVLKGASLSEGYTTEGVANDSALVVDPTHDAVGPHGSPAFSKRSVRKIIYVDAWTYQMYLDGILVEEWEHDFGIVPIFPAYGEQTSDRDPAYQSVGIADAAIGVAKEIVMFSAIMASSGMMHGFPTPFLKNPQHGLTTNPGNEPNVRRVALGQMNLLGIGESIEFPYLDANMSADFGKHLEWLMNQLESATLSNFGKAIGSDIAGYAVAQIRNSQQSILSTIYSNAKRQWRKIYYFLRHLITVVFPAGLALRGPVQEDEESGNPFRATFTYGKKEVTDFSLDVDIKEGIPQDEIAQHKDAVEMNQAGLWSKRRAMEATGVDDPASEDREIRLAAMRASPGYQQSLMQLAMRKAALRQQTVQREELASPFNQALKEVQGGGVQGAPQNQASEPENSEGGTPLNEDVAVGPAAQTQPGGVDGQVQTPAVGAVGG